MTHPEPRLTYVLVGVAVNLRNFHFRVTIVFLGTSELTFYLEKNLKEFSSRKLQGTLNRVRGQEVRLNRSSYGKVMVIGNRSTVLGRYYIGALWSSRVHLEPRTFSLLSPAFSLSPILSPVGSPLPAEISLFRPPHDLKSVPKCSPMYHLHPYTHFIDRIEMWEEKP